MERLIALIKSGFRSEISSNDPKVKKLQKFSYELNLLTGNQLFEMSIKEKAAWNKKVKKLTEDTNKLEAEIEEIKANKIFENAFEWRFEFPEVLNDDGDFVGFDAVIGNPPYFSLEKSDIDYFSVSSRFKTIEKRGDIYTLFYELGMKIISTKNTLCYITSSTWMRSNYGKSLRSFLLEHYNPYQLIDFSDYPVFESATVLTNIIFITKNNYDGQTSSCLIDHSMRPSFMELKDFIAGHSYDIKDFDSSAWSVSTKMKHEIRKRIEHKGTRLKQHGYNISNGFRTGFNEAFIINYEIKEKLINEDSNCSRIIKPLLRGRDIKKLLADFDDQFVIIVGHGKGEALKEEYPSIYKRLQTFETELKNRGQVKNGQHHYLELDNHPSDKYLDLFEKPKIIYPEITKFLPFVFDNTFHYYSNNKTFFINGDKLESLVSFLNSKLFKYAFSETFPELQGKSRELRKVFMEQIPYFQPDNATHNLFQEKVTKIIDLKKENPDADTSELENQIDQLVYQLYDLTEDEIEIIEKTSL